MKLRISLFFVFAILSFVEAKIDPRNLRCIVCQTTFEELDKVIMAVDRKKLVEVGNFRMDASGNTMQQRVPAHRSDVYISEVIEGICTKLNDYVRVTFKSTGKLTIMPMDVNGGMNPMFSMTKFITDDDLNKSLEYYCERIFEENEEIILSVYKNRPEDDVMPDALHSVCFKHAGYCDEWMLVNETDTTWTEEDEKNYIKIHGPDPYGFGGLGGYGGGIGGGMGGWSPQESDESEESVEADEEYDEEESRRQAEMLGMEEHDEL